MDLHIKNVQPDLLRRIKSAAALRGVTLKEFVVEALTKALEDNSDAKRQPRNPADKEQPTDNS